MPCRAHAMPRQCHSESDFSRPRHSAAWAWHGMCELASAVQRRHVGDLPVFGLFWLPSGVPRRMYQKHTNPLNCRASSSDISGYHADFHEGHGTVGEWQWRGTAWHGNGRARHGMCELALRRLWSTPTINRQTLKLSSYILFRAPLLYIYQKRERIRMTSTKHVENLWWRTSKERKTHTKKRKHKKEKNLKIGLPANTALLPTYVTRTPGT
jgi:hypothetical protein